MIKVQYGCILYSMYRCTTNESGTEKVVNDELHKHYLVYNSYNVNC